MPEIRPFRAARYNPAIAGDLGTVVAPPYDVISPAQQRELYARSPYNVVRVELTAPEPGDPPGAAGDAARHLRARATLDGWIADGVVQRDGDPSLYLYEQRFSYGGRERSQRSILAAVRLSPWNESQVLPHEHTMAAPKAERLNLLRATRANISPIWSLYQDEGGSVAEALASTWAGEPIAHFDTEDGIVHTLWSVNDRSVVGSVAAALARRQIYIADGHHRYETALAYRAEDQRTPHQSSRDYVLMALTEASDPGLEVLPTHRMLADLPQERLAALPDLLGRFFDVEDVDLPARAEDLDAFFARLLPVYGPGYGAHRFALLGPEANRLRVLQPRQDVLSDLPAPPALGDLDVWLAHAMILERLLGLDAGALERQEHVTYTRDAATAVEAVRSGDQQLALFLAPTPVSQLLAVARAGAVMPQKSTYFFPKLATGLVIRLLD